MERRPLIFGLTALILLVSIILAALGVRTLEREASHADERYQSRAEAVLTSFEDALKRLADELVLGSLADRHVDFDAEGAIVGAPPDARPPPYASELKESLESLTAEVSELVSAGHSKQARALLRSYVDETSSPRAANEALFRFAGLAAEEGRGDDARAAYSELLNHRAVTRDDQGLSSHQVARQLLAQLEVKRTADRAARLWLDNLEELLIEQGDLLNHARNELKRLALGGLEELAERGALSSTQAARDLRVRARDRAARTERSARTLFYWAREQATANTELPAQSVFHAPREEGPTGAPATDADHVLVCLDRHPDGAPSRAASMKLSELITSALTLPESRATAALGFELDVRELCEQQPMPKDAPPALLERRLPRPFRSVLARVIGRDRDAFLAAERRGFWIGAGLSVGAVLVIVLAAFTLLRAIAREVEAARARESFVAAVTHELKTPLASIRLLAELLGRNEVAPAKAREFAHRITSETDRLSRLVTQVLELSKIEQGVEALPLKAFDFAALLRTLVEELRLTASDRGFELSLEGAEGPQTILGDPDALRGVIANLLDNAMKYSDQPHLLELDLTRCKLGAKQPGYRLSVHDRGRGIPARERQRVFEPFGRGGDEMTRDRPGVGLGLALAARVARAHGGALSFEARSGGGTTFMLDIPGPESLSEASGATTGPP